MEQCESCKRDLSDSQIWAFKTTDKVGEYHFCSKECADEGIAKLERLGYKTVTEIVNGN